MTSLSLEAIKAKHGDALLLTADETTVLIDGGPPGVFNRFLKDAVERLDHDTFDYEPPVIDLVVVSHVDSDHIAGILDLTDDLIEAQQGNTRSLATIRRAWHNSFADTVAAAGGPTPQKTRASAASLASVYEDEADIFAAVTTPATQLVLSSVSQGRNLRRDLKTLSVDVNGRFRNRLVLRENNPNPWVRGDLSLTVIGPTKIELDKLQTEWAKQLPKILQKEAEKEARAAAAGSLDSSVFNLASIVVIAEANGKRMLLTGDARGDKILNWLEAAGLSNWPVHFDVLKLPHHGSDRNVCEKFFRKVTADNYLVSGNGKHGNPEPEMFEMLAKARPDSEFTIHMTYSPDEIMGHSDYAKNDRKGKLKRVLNENANLQDLVFPAAGATSISVAV